ncbi:MAG TPA: DUF3830 family protein [Steroidobacter sp.]
MTRYIRIREERSGLDCRAELLDAEAPRAAAALWAIAGQGGRHFAQHAMWTGPEISCPVSGAQLPDRTIFEGMPLENGTMFPAAGDIATVWAPRGLWKGMPDTDVFDIGLFYAEGARLLLPMGWIMASVAARIVPEDFAKFQAGCQAIRRGGACELEFSREPEVTS